MKSQQEVEAVRHLIVHCGGLKSGESLLIVYDRSTADLARHFIEQGKSITDNVNSEENALAERHGQEPTGKVREAMLRSNLIISLCRFSLAHSSARVDAGRRGARFLSLPLYSWEMLRDPAVMVNYRDQYSTVKYITDAFTLGEKVHVQGRSGTDITLDISGRVGNCCPGFVEDPCSLGSPPDIESNVSPIEDRSEGIIVVDGSITCPEIGLLASSVILEVEKGLVKNITSHESSCVVILNKLFGADAKRSMLAECGIGLNPLAKLTGTMLTDEGAFGCIHFGFGSNITVGGANRVDFHLDFVFRYGTLKIDNRIYMRDGELDAGVS